MFERELALLSTLWCLSVRQRARERDREGEREADRESDEWCLRLDERGEGVCVGEGNIVGALSGQGAAC